jgi:hypothetical protein
MALIGVKLLGNSFVQDNNPNWIKIDNVAIGESREFGYDTTNSNGDIGKLLNNIDKNTTCVIYNWNNHAVYLKTGFNLNNCNDYKLAQGYTSFILKSKIKDYYTPTPAPIPAPAPALTQNDFVQWNNKQFVLNGKKFVPVGTNVYWLGYTENNDYPTHEQVIEMFEVTQKMASTVMRVHTLGHSSGTRNSLRPSDNNLNNNAWESIDYAFSIAKQYNIKIIAPLTDSYSWYNGNYGDYCKTRGVSKELFWTDPIVRADFKDYIYKWLNHYNKYNKCMIKDDPTLAMIELGNELGNIRPNSNSITIPTEEWLKDITNYIKSIDTKHLILGPSDECLGKSGDFRVQPIDVYSAHFYWDDDNRIRYGLNESRRVNKPYIIGEYSVKLGEQWLRKIEQLGVNGSIMWNCYSHYNGLNGGDKVWHDDGETWYYPENKKELLIITNHHRRMRNLQEINSL